jgi:hypothetical protein
MTTVLLTAALFLLAVLAMVGAGLITGRSLRGSCGGPSCRCAAEGEDVIRCQDRDDDTISLPMHPGVD